MRSQGKSRTKNRAHRKPRRPQSASKPRRAKTIRQSGLAERPLIVGRRGVAKVGVITVIDHEINQLRPTLDCMKNLTGTSYWVDRVRANKRYDIVLRQLADRGNLACQEATSELIEDFRPHFIILVGIGGGIGGRDETAVGDVVVVDYVEYYEYQKLTNRQSLPRKIPFDHPSRLLCADVARPILHRGEWANALTHARPRAGACKAIVGNLITGEKLLADRKNEFQRDILRKFDKAIAVDMEACGMARAVFSARSSIHYNVQYAIVRGVSDLVDAANNDGMRKAWRPYAANAAATFASQMIDVLLEIISAKGR